MSASTWYPTCPLRFYVSYDIRDLELSCCQPIIFYYMCMLCLLCRFNRFSSDMFFVQPVSYFFSLTEIYDKWFCNICHKPHVQYYVFISNQSIVRLRNKCLLYIFQFLRHSYYILIFILFLCWVLKGIFYLRFASNPSYNNSIAGISQVVLCNRQSVLKTHGADHCQLLNLTTPSLPDAVYYCQNHEKKQIFYEISGFDAHVRRSGMLYLPP